MNLSAIAFFVLMGLACIAAAFVGATVNQYQLYPCLMNRRRIRDALVLFVVLDCVLVLLVLWTLPLWAPTWLR
jgi:hypothetical protein